jgi:organic radical activating enzyme
MICLDPFKNLNIVSKNQSLEISPCCISPTVPSSGIDFVNNPYLDKIRKSWNDGHMPAECQACHKQPSRKDASNQWYKTNGYNNTDVELIRVDYWVGDTCNLQCVICGPHNSSAWKQELGIQGWRQENNQFWHELDLHKLQHIHFNGGEPLLSKEHLDFLQAIPNKQQVEINYNTNGTIVPSVRLQDLWSQFKLIILDFSIDDIETQFEYQRFPAKWTKIVENLQWYVDHAPVNTMFAVNTTVSILNQNNMTRLEAWLANNFSQNRLGDSVLHRKQPAVGLFALDSADTKMHGIVKFLNDCDARRGTNWKTVFPDLAEKYINIT